MKILECVKAHAVVRELMHKEMDYKSAHAIMLLNRAMMPHSEFYAAEERKLIERYGARGDDGRVKFDGNSWELADRSLAAEYAREEESLRNLDVQGFNEAVRIPAMPDMTPAQMEALEGFIVFGEEG